MFSAIITFVGTVVVAFLVGSLSNSSFWAILAAIAFVGAVIVYKLNRLYKALVPESEPTFDDTPEEDDDEVIEEVPEEESYGVNDLTDDEE